MSVSFFPQEKDPENFPIDRHSRALGSDLTGSLLSKLHQFNEKGS